MRVTLWGFLRLSVPDLKGRLAPKKGGPKGLPDVKVATRRGERPELTVQNLHGAPRRAM